ncbi:hypothetical protein IW262DRAFT_1517927 [Armillaria fumosa]|nr:hypothetical protein IW262DRAFT_1517927 [Armillaria fumosa]
MTGANDVYTQKVQPKEVSGRAIFEIEDFHVHPSTSLAAICEKRTKTRQPTNLHRTEPSADTHQHKANLCTRAQDGEDIAIDVNLDGDLDLQVHALLVRPSLLLRIRLDSADLWGAQNMDTGEYQCKETCLGPRWGDLYSVPFSTALVVVTGSIDARRGKLEVTRRLGFLKITPGWEKQETCTTKIQSEGWSCILQRRCGGRSKSLDEVSNVPVGTLSFKISGLSTAGVFFDEGFGCTA